MQNTLRADGVMVENPTTADIDERLQWAESNAIAMNKSIQVWTNFYSQDYDNGVLRRDFLWMRKEITRLRDQLSDAEYKIESLS